MLFNSISFFIFFGLILLLYFPLKHKWQNWLLLVASYVFYSAWNWRFLFLIFAGTIIDYFCGLKIEKTKNQKQFLAIGIVINLLILCFFKYYNFFSENLNWRFYHIILPVGLSFYTFRKISYLIDVYRKDIPASKNFRDFALFVAFFPQLIAGPIEKAKNFLKQIELPRKITVEKIYQGGYLIGWGLFQKIFIADNLAKIVDNVFASKAPDNGLITLLAIYAFTLQIYCDFAGYSNIAKGVSRFFGFNQITNFNLPYFAVNPRQFWDRWHISLSQWFKDYVYIPLGGNRKGELATIGNLMITMILCGIWHGTGWTFALWGTYQGILLTIHRLYENRSKKQNSLSVRSSFKQKSLSFLKWFSFFHITCLGWLIFRSSSLSQLGQMIKSFFGPLNFSGDVFRTSLKIIFLSWLLILVEIFQYIKKDEFAILKVGVAYRVILYLLIYFLILVYGISIPQEFIYFQF